jgi:hypothetical protein
MATLPADRILDTCLAKSRNMMIPWFLQASWLYYHADTSLLTDERYDRLCKELDAEWDDLTHVHKGVIDREALAAGTAFSIPDEAYPTMCVTAACHLAGIPQPPLIERAQYALPQRHSRPTPLPEPQPEVQFRVRSRPRADFATRFKQETL